MYDFRKRILNDAIAGEDGIIHVDTFLNHQLDIDFLEAVGDELAKRFKGAGVTKVLTVESSGIAVACFVARSLELPALYAKKFQTGYMNTSVYESEIHSFSLSKGYTLRVSKQCLDENDVVLIVDDILANGQSILGLLEIIAKAKAETAGVGVVIEKANKDGGRMMRQIGIRLESLVVVERVENCRLVLRD